MPVLPPVPSEPFHRPSMRRRQSQPRQIGSRRPAETTITRWRGRWFAGEHAQRDSLVCNRMPKRQDRPRRSMARGFERRQFPHARQQTVRRPSSEQDAAVAPDPCGIMCHRLGLVFAPAVRQIILLSVRPSEADATQRADGAARIGGCANQCSQFHQGLVERAGVAGWKNLRGQNPTRFAGGWFRHVGANTEHPGKHPHHVPVDQRDSPAEGDAGNRACGVSADAGQFHQRVDSPWEFPAVVAYDQFRGEVEIPGSRIIAEAFPQLEHAAVGHARQGWDGRERADPASVISTHDVDTGLLQHDFADPDLVRVVRRPPRQFPVMPVIPADQGTVEGADDGRRHMVSRLIGPESLGRLWRNAPGKSGSPPRLPTTFSIDPRGGAVESCRHGRAHILHVCDSR